MFIGPYSSSSFFLTSSAASLALLNGGHKAQAKAIINSLWRNSHPDVRKSLEEGLEKNARGNYKVEDSTKKRREARWANVERLESKKLPRNGQL